MTAVKDPKEQTPLDVPSLIDEVLDEQFAGHGVFRRLAEGADDQVLCSAVYVLAFSRWCKQHDIKESETAFWEFSALAEDCQERIVARVKNVRAALVKDLKEKP